MVDSSAAIQTVLPRGRSRGGELGEERGLAGGSRPSAAEVHERGWASFARGSSPGSVQSWVGTEKTAHDPFSIFKFLFRLNKSIWENKNRRNT
jgi:hypothetical protein